LFSLINFYIFSKADTIGQVTFQSLEGEIASKMSASDKLYLSGGMNWK